MKLHDKFSGNMSWVFSGIGTFFIGGILAFLPKETLIKSYSYLSQNLHKFLETTLTVKEISYTIIFFFIIYFFHKKYKEKELQKTLSDSDIRILMSSSWPKKGDNEVITIEYKKYDKKCNIPRGSTKRLIEKIAQEKYYKILHKGDTYIQLESDFEKFLDNIYI